MSVFIGLLIPFFGTVLGSLMVYFLRKNLSKKIEVLILGFAAGVMMAASVWSLLIPAMDMSQGIKWLPATIGLVIGILFFFFIDYLLDKNKINTSKSIDKMMFAITIHNIPEGMALGVVFASFLTNSNISLATCYALAIGIGIQNFPEGFIVSMPLRNKGMSKTASFIYGVISAIFELLGAIVTLLFTRIISVMLPYLLAFAAGAMIYVILVELIPESTENNKLNTIGFLIGFAIMMILDIALA